MMDWVVPAITTALVLRTVLPVSSPDYIIEKCMVGANAVARESVDVEHKVYNRVFTKCIETSFNVERK